MQPSNRSRIHLRLLIVAVTASLTLLPGATRGQRDPRPASQTIIGFDL